MLALGCGLGLLAPTTASADCIDGRPVTVGHRGTGNSTADNPQPENTIPALIEAANEGATMVEIDVQLTADGAVVLMHDATVDRTTDGSGCVTELTLDQLSALDAGEGTPAAGQGIAVPTLEDVLEAVDLDLNVELKDGGDGCPVSDPAVVATAVLDALAADETSRTSTVSSFDLELLQAIRDQDAAIYIGLITVTPASMQAALDADFDALNLVEGSIDEATVTQLRDAGLELNAWTVDSQPRIEELFGLDVDSIITNEPPLVEAVRQQQCPGQDDTADDTGAGSDDTAAGSDDTAAPGGTVSGGAADGDDSGCACRSVPSHRNDLAWWALGGWLLWRRRRHSNSTARMVSSVASTSSTPSAS